MIHDNISLLQPPWGIGQLDAYIGLCMTLVAAADNSSGAIVAGRTPEIAETRSYRFMPQTAVPKRLPTPAVAPMASAPQKATRIAPRTMPAPPAFAPTAPRRPSRSKVAAMIAATLLFPRH